MKNNRLFSIFSFLLDKTASIAGLGFSSKLIQFIYSFDKRLGWYFDAVLCANLGHNDNAIKLFSLVASCNEYDALYYISCASIDFLSEDKPKSNYTISERYECRYRQDSFWETIQRLEAYTYMPYRYVNPIIKKEKGQFVPSND